MKLCSCIALAGFTFGAVATSSAVNIIENGDFSVQPDSAWSQFATNGQSLIGNFANVPGWSGGYARLGGYSDAYDELAQYVDLTNATSAVLKFDVALLDRDDPGDWDTLEIGFYDADNNIDYLLYHVDLGAYTNNQYSIFLNNQADVSALAGDDYYLYFAVQDDDWPNSHSAAYVDNVSLDVTYEAVPEPASMAVLGFGAVAFLRRRARKSS